MKKSILFVSLASVSAIACSLAFALNRKDSNNLQIAKATDKTFTFDASVGSSQFNKSYGSEIANEDVITLVGDPIDTSVSYSETGTERGKVFGEDGWFVQKSGGTTHGTFTIIVGLNNCTHVNVKYGSTYTGNDDTLNASIILKDANGDKVDEANQTLTDNYTTGNLTWNKDAGNSVKTIEIEVEHSVFLYWGYDFYIESMTFNWSC